MDDSPPPIKLPPTDLTREERHFLDNLGPLFWREQARVRESYDDLIYGFTRPITFEYATRAFAFTGVNTNGSTGVTQSGTPGSRRAAKQEVTPAPWSQSFTSAVFPETRQLLETAKIPGATLSAAATLMHFCTPSYPAYMEASVKGLKELGRKVDHTHALDSRGLAAYDNYVRELQRLKDAATFRQVPETYYFLTRIVEAALAAYSRE